MSIWKFLGLPDRPDEGGDRAGGVGGLREIVDRLEHLEPEHARHIATFAFILGRVAHADLDISREETLAMERAVQQLGGLAEEEAILVVQMAKAQHRLFGATDNFSITRSFTLSTAREQRLALLECLFAVSAADEHISGVEENEIRRIGQELDLTHDDYIEARIKYREYVAVLKQAGQAPGGGGS
jgi:uncharacterized tellurite resistance protein B-like protein